jgi:hypothetical protein
VSSVPSLLLASPDPEKDQVGNMEIPAPKSSTRLERCTAANERKDGKNSLKLHPLLIIEILSYSSQFF